MRKVIDYVKRKRSGSSEGALRRSTTVEFNYDTSSTYASSESVVSGNDTISIYDAGSVNKGWTKLHIAAWVGDVHRIRAKLKTVEVDTKDGVGRTALHLAATQGHANAVALLLSCRADASIQDDNGITPLHKAMEFRHRDCIHLLLDRGTEGLVNVSDSLGDTPLHVATRVGSYDLSLMLLRRGSNPEIANNEGQYPLHNACLSDTKDTHELIELLLRYGALINVVDKNNVTPLMLASSKGIVNIVRLFIEYGADKKAKDINGKTAYRYAMENSFHDIEEIVRFSDDSESGNEQRNFATTLSRESINVITPPMQFHSRSPYWSDDDASVNDDNEIPMGERLSGAWGEAEEKVMRKATIDCTEGDTKSESQQQVRSSPVRPDFLSPLPDARRDSFKSSHIGQGDADRSTGSISQNDDGIKEVDSAKEASGDAKTSGSDWEDDFSLPIDSCPRLSLTKSPFRIGNYFSENKSVEKVFQTGEDEKSQASVNNLEINSDPKFSNEETENKRKDAAILAGKKSLPINLKADGSNRIEGIKPFTSLCETFSGLEKNHCHIDFKLEEGGEQFDFIDEAEDTYSIEIDRKIARSKVVKEIGDIRSPVKSDSALGNLADDEDDEPDTFQSGIRKIDDSEKLETDFFGNMNDIVKETDNDVSTYSSSLTDVTGEMSISDGTKKKYTEGLEIEGNGQMVGVKDNEEIDQCKKEKQIDCIPDHRETGSVAANIDNLVKISDDDNWSSDDGDANLQERKTFKLFPLKNSPFKAFFDTHTEAEISENGQSKNLESSCAENIEPSIRFPLEKDESDEQKISGNEDSKELEMGDKIEISGNHLQELHDLNKFTGIKSETSNAEDNDARQQTIVEWRTLKPAQTKLKPLFPTRLSRRYEKTVAKGEEMGMELPDQETNSKMLNSTDLRCLNPITSDDNINEKDYSFNPSPLSKENSDRDEDDSNNSDDTSISQIEDEQGNTVQNQMGFPNHDRIPSSKKSKSCESSPNALKYQRGCKSLSISPRNISADIENLISPISKLSSSTSLSSRKSLRGDTTVQNNSTDFESSPDVKKLQQGYKSAGANPRKVYEVLENATPSPIKEFVRIFNARPPLAPIERNIQRSKSCLSPHKVLKNIRDSRSTGVSPRDDFLEEAGFRMKYRLVLPWAENIGYETNEGNNDSDSSKSISGPSSVSDEAPSGTKLEGSSLNSIKPIRFDETDAMLGIDEIWLSNEVMADDARTVLNRDKRKDDQEEERTEDETHRLEDEKIDSGDDEMIKNEDEAASNKEENEDESQATDSFGRKSESEESIMSGIETSNEVSDQNIDRESIEMRESQESVKCSDNLGDELNKKNNKDVVDTINTSNTAGFVGIFEYCGSAKLGTVSKERVEADLNCHPILNLVSCDQNSEKSSTVSNPRKIHTRYELEENQNEGEINDNISGSSTQEKQFGMQDQAVPSKMYKDHFLPSQDCDNLVCNEGVKKMIPGETSVDTNDSLSETNVSIAEEECLSLHENEGKTISGKSEDPTESRASKDTSGSSSMSDLSKEEEKNSMKKHGNIVAGGSEPCRIPDRVSERIATFFARESLVSPRKVQDSSESSGSRKSLRNRSRCNGDCSNRGGDGRSSSLDGNDSVMDKKEEESPEGNDENDDIEMETTSVNEEEEEGCDDNDEDEDDPLEEEQFSSLGEAEYDPTNEEEEEAFQEQSFEEGKEGKAPETHESQDRRYSSESIRKLSPGRDAARSRHNRSPQSHPREHVRKKSPGSLLGSPKNVRGAEDPPRSFASCSGVEDRKDGFAQRESTDRAAASLVDVPRAKERQSKNRIKSKKMMAEKPEDADDETSPCGRITEEGKPCVAESQKQYTGNYGSGDKCKGKDTKAPEDSSEAVDAVDAPVNKNVQQQVKVPQGENPSDLMDRTMKNFPFLIIEPVNLLAEISGRHYNPVARTRCRCRKFRPINRLINDFQNFLFIPADEGNVEDDNMYTSTPMSSLGKFIGVDGNEQRYEAAPVKLMDSTRASGKGPPWDSMGKDGMQNSSNSKKPAYSRNWSTETDRTESGESFEVLPEKRMNSIRESISENGSSRDSMQESKEPAYSRNWWTETDSANLGTPGEREENYTMLSNASTIPPEAWADEAGNRLSVPRKSYQERKHGEKSDRGVGFLSRILYNNGKIESFSSILGELSVEGKEGCLADGNTGEDANGKLGEDKQEQCSLRSDQTMQSSSRVSFANLVSSSMKQEAIRQKPISFGNPESINDLINEEDQLIGSPIENNMNRYTQTLESFQRGFHAVQTESCEIGSVISADEQVSVSLTEGESKEIDEKGANLQKEGKRNASTETKDLSSKDRLLLNDLIQARMNTNLEEQDELHMKEIGSAETANTSEGGSQCEWNQEPEHQMFTIVEGGEHVVKEGNKKEDSGSGFSFQEIRIANPSKASRGIQKTMIDYYPEIQTPSQASSCIGTRTVQNSPGTQIPSKASSGIRKTMVQNSPGTKTPTKISSSISTRTVQTKCRPVFRNVVRTGIQKVKEQGSKERYKITASKVFRIAKLQREAQSKSASAASVIQYVAESQIAANEDSMNRSSSQTRLGQIDLEESLGLMGQNISAEESKAESVRSFPEEKPFDQLVENDSDESMGSLGINEPIDEPKAQSFQFSPTEKPSDQLEEIIARKRSVGIECTIGSQIMDESNEDNSTETLDSKNSVQSKLLVGSEKSSNLKTGSFDKCVGFCRLSHKNPFMPRCKLKSTIECIQELLNDIHEPLQESNYTKSATKISHLPKNDGCSIIANNNTFESPKAQLSFDNLYSDDIHINLRQNPVMSLSSRIFRDEDNGNILKPSRSSLSSDSSYESLKSSKSLPNLQLALIGSNISDESGSEVWSTEARTSDKSLHKRFNERMRLLANLRSCVGGEAEKGQSLEEMGDNCLLRKKILYNFSQDSRNSDSENSGEMRTTSSSKMQDGTTIGPFNVGSTRNQCTIGSTRTAADISESPETHGDVKKVACPSHADCPVTILRPKYEEAIAKMANLAKELEKAKKGASIPAGAQERLMSVGSDVREAVTLLREDYNMVEATLKKHNGALEALTAKLRGDGGNLDAFMKDKGSPNVEPMDFRKVHRFKALEEEMEILRKKLASRRLDENTKTLETVALLQHERSELQATINGLNQTLVDHRIKVAELKEENRRFKSSREILQNDLEAHIAEVNYLAKRSVPNDPSVVRKISKLEEQNRKLTANYDDLVKSLEKERELYQSQMEQLLGEVPPGGKEDICGKKPSEGMRSGADRMRGIDELKEISEALNIRLYPYGEQSRSDPSLGTEMCPILHNIIQQRENDTSSETSSVKNNDDDKKLALGNKKKKKSSKVARVYYLVAPVACPVADKKNKDSVRKDLDTCEDPAEIPKPSSFAAMHGKGKDKDGSSGNEKRDEAFDTTDLSSRKGGTARKNGGKKSDPEQKGRNNLFPSFRKNSLDSSGSKVAKSWEPTEKKDQSMDCERPSPKKSKKSHHEKRKDSASSHIIDDHGSCDELSATPELHSSSGCWRLQKKTEMIPQYKETVPDRRPKAASIARRASKSKIKHSMMERRSSQSKLRRLCHKASSELSGLRTNGGRSIVFEAKSKDKSRKASAIRPSSIKSSQRLPKPETPEGTISSSETKQEEDSEQKIKMPQKKSLPKKPLKPKTPPKNDRYVGDETEGNEFEQCIELASFHPLIPQVLKPHDQEIVTDAFTGSNSSVGVVQTEISVSNRLLKETPPEIPTTTTSSDLSSMVAMQMKPKLTWKTEILVNIDPRAEDTKLSKINPTNQFISNAGNSEASYDVEVPVGEVEGSSDADGSSDFADVGKLLCSILSKRCLTDDSWTNKDSSIALVEKLSEMMLKSVKNQDSDLSCELIAALQKGVSSECCQNVAKRLMPLYSSMPQIEKIGAKEMEPVSTGGKSMLSNESPESKEAKESSTCNLRESYEIGKCCEDLVASTSLSKIIDKLVEERSGKDRGEESAGADFDRMEDRLREKSLEELAAIANISSQSAVETNAPSDSRVDQDTKASMEPTDEDTVVVLGREDTSVEIGDSMNAYPREASQDSPSGETVAEEPAKQDSKTGLALIQQLVEEVMNWSIGRTTCEPALGTDLENRDRREEWKTRGLEDETSNAMMNQPGDSVASFGTVNCVSSHPEEEYGNSTDDSICKPIDTAAGFKSSDASIRSMVHHSIGKMIESMGSFMQIGQPEEATMSRGSKTEHEERASESALMAERTEESLDHLQAAQSARQQLAKENSSEYHIVVVSQEESISSEEKWKTKPLLERISNDDQGLDQLVPDVPSREEIEDQSAKENTWFPGFLPFGSKGPRALVALEQDQPCSNTGNQHESPKPTASIAVGDTDVGEEESPLEEATKPSEKSVVDTASGSDAPFQAFDLDTATKPMSTEQPDPDTKPAEDETIRKEAAGSAKLKDIASAAKPSTATKYSMAPQHRTMDTGAGRSRMTITSESKPGSPPSRRSSIRSPMDRISQMMDSLENALPSCGTSLATKARLPSAGSSASTFSGCDELYEGSCSELPRKSNLCRGRKNRARVQSVRFNPQVKCCSSEAVDAKRSCSKRTEFIQGAQTLTCGGNAIVKDQTEGVDNIPMPDMSQTHRISMQNCAIYGTRYAMTSFSGSDPGSPVILIGGREASPENTFSSVLCPMHPVLPQEYGSNERYDCNRAVEDDEDEDGGQRTTLDAWHHLHGELSRIKRKILEEEGALNAEKQRFRYEAKKMGQKVDFPTNPGGLQSLRNEVDELLGLLGTKGGSEGMDLLGSSTNAQRVRCIIAKHAEEEFEGTSNLYVDENIERVKAMAVESIGRVANLFDDIEPKAGNAEPEKPSPEVVTGEEPDGPSSRKPGKKDTAEGKHDGSYDVTSSLTRLQQNIQSCGERRVFGAKMERPGEEDLRSLLEWNPSKGKLPVERDEQLKRLDAAIARARGLTRSSYSLLGQPEAPSGGSSRNATERRRSEYGKVENSMGSLPQTHRKDCGLRSKTDDDNRDSTNVSSSYLANNGIPPGRMKPLNVSDEGESWWSVEPRRRLEELEERIPFFQNPNASFKGKGGKVVCSKRSQSLDRYLPPRQTHPGVQTSVLGEARPRSRKALSTLYSPIGNANASGMRKARNEGPAITVNVRSTKGSTAFRPHPVEFPRNAVASIVPPGYNSKNETSRLVFKRMLRVNSREYERGRGSRLETPRRKSNSSNASSPDDSLMAELRTKYFDSFLL